jgi:hypothetical protein
MLIGLICVCALSEKRATEQRYCGAKLVNTLKFLCAGHYHGLDEEWRWRRSVEDSPAETVEGTVYTTSRNKGETVFYFLRVEDFTALTM